MTREEAVKAIKSHCYFANLVPVGKEALNKAIEALEAEPCENTDPKNRIARERYEDLVGYFGGDKTILESREEFQKWLARIKWHVKKCDKLAREVDELKKEALDQRADAISRKWVLDVVNNFVFDTETDRNRIVHIVRDTAPSVMPKEKQEPVLDKIRAEIEKIAKPNEVGGRGYKESIRYGLCIALEIIDKYKAEGEAEE